ncbi:hypothetical protein [Halalkalibacter akibai]|uniref:hypothetical protein n=1 Tax=Halalkalibacter akibai TaxID=1411 RepID=UPI0011DDC179|nr:hypothetical protein [Halalkalibacter akibai]
MLYVFTIQTNFNLAGYSFVIEDEYADPVTVFIEEGFINKEKYEMEMTTGQALTLVMSINQADDLWMISMVLIMLFLTGFFILFSSPIRESKYIIWYVGFYLLLLIIVVIWIYTTQSGITEDIVRNIELINVSSGGVTGFTS